MSVGCFGNSPEDRYMEGELNKYLESQEDHTMDDIELTREEVEVFLKVIGNMPSKFEKIDDAILSNLFDEPEDYSAIMKLWERLHDLTGERE